MHREPLGPVPPFAVAAAVAAAMSASLGPFRFQRGAAAVYDSIVSGVWATGKARTKLRHAKIVAAHMTRERRQVRRDSFRTIQKR
jgi:ribosomal protein L14